MSGGRLQSSRWVCGLRGLLYIEAAVQSLERLSQGRRDLTAVKQLRQSQGCDNNNDKDSSAKRAQGAGFTGDN